MLRHTNDLSQYRITDIDNKKILICQEKELKDHDFCSLVGLTKQHDIGYIDLSNCYIGDEGVEKIVACIKQGWQLRGLYLRKCGLTARALNDLAGILSTSSICELDLSHNCMASPEAKNMELKNFLNTLPNSQLKTLYLQACDISPQGLGLIARCLSRTKIIKASFVENSSTLYDNAVAIALDQNKKREHYYFLLTLGAILGNGFRDPSSPMHQLPKELLIDIAILAASNPDISFKPSMTVNLLNKFFFNKPQIKTKPILEPQEQKKLERKQKFCTIQ